MNKKKRLQENEYSYPYHYFLKRGTIESIFFFTYIDTIKDYLINTKSKLIIDAGCGDAFLFHNIKNDLLKNNNKLVGIDYSERAISFARLFNNEMGVDFKVLDLEKNSENIGPLLADVVISSHVFEHIPQEKEAAFFQTTKGLLAPKGEFIMIVPSKSLKIQEKHFRHFTEKEIKDIFNKNGFMIVNYFQIFNVFFFRALGIFFNRFWRITIFEKILFNICLKNFRKTNTGLMHFIVAKKI